MATTIGNERDILDLLKNLAELDLDAVEAYRAAVSRIDDPLSKQSLAVFQADHERHVQSLRAAISRRGGTPPEKGDVKQILTKGKVVLGGLFGDKTILRAMKSNEDDTNTAYERAASRSDLSPELLELMRRHLEDERRHRDWIVARIEQIESEEEARATPGT
jgi:uncharacterized protein (TIGR02284 family)